MSLKSSKISLAAAALALFVAGCGGGDSTSSLTKAQFIKRADAICTKANNDQLVAVQKAAKSTPKSEQNQAGKEKIIVTAGLPPIAKEAEELAELGIPDGDEKEVEAIIAGIEFALKKGEENPVLVLEGAASPFIPVNKLAAAYGLESCAENP